MSDTNLIHQLQGAVRRLELGTRGGSALLSWTTGNAESAVLTVTHGMVDADGNAVTPQRVHADGNGTGGPSVFEAQPFNIGPTTFDVQGRFLNGVAGADLSVPVGWTAHAAAP